MARNKRGHEMAAGYKTKEDIQLAKTTGAYEVEVDKGIVESSSELQEPQKVAQRALKRALRAIRRQARIRKMMNKRGAHSIEIPDKKYDVLAQYHQLNYNAVKDVIKENNIVCEFIDNTHLWIYGVDSEQLETIKKVLISCHFRTKQGKEYKIRIAAYRSRLQVSKKKKTSKPSNNTTKAKIAAKKARKLSNVERALSWVGHKQRRAKAGKLRSQRKKTKNHKPAVIDTSSAAKKLRERIKKAIQANERSERNKAIQAKSRASKPISEPKSKKEGKQLNFAA